MVEDGPPGEPELEEEAVASARGRIVSCLAYSPGGRVADADVRIESNPVTEGYVEAILDPETRLSRLRSEGGSEALVAAIERRAGEVGPDVRRRIAARRAELVENGPVVETYRRLELDEALARLAAGG